VKLNSNINLVLVSPLNIGDAAAAVPRQDWTVDDLIGFMWGQHGFDPARRNRVLTEAITDEQRVPLQGREEAYQRLQRLVKNELLYGPNGVKDHHARLMLTGMPGVGKTRYLLDGVTAMHDLVNPKWPVIELYMTYNQGYIASTTEKRLDAEEAIAWRMLFFHFLGGAGPLIGTFFEKVEDWRRRHVAVSIDRAIECIIIDTMQHRDALQQPSQLLQRQHFEQHRLPQATHADRSASDRAPPCAVFFWQIDEVQEAAVVNAVLLHTLMNMCMAAQLHGALESRIQVIPVVAGLYNSDVHAVMKLSTLVEQLIPLTPLSFEQAAELLRCWIKRHSYPTECLRWKALRNTLFQVCSTPRAILMFNGQLTSLYNMTKEGAETMSKIAVAANSLKLLVAYGLTGKILPSNLLVDAKSTGMLVEKDGLRAQLPWRILQTYAEVSTDESAFHDAAKELVRTAHNEALEAWQMLEFSFGSIQALRLNAALATSDVSGAPRRLLEDALPGAKCGSNMNLTLRGEITVRMFSAELKLSNIAGNKVDGMRDSDEWTLHSGVYMCFPGQEAVDCITLIRGSSESPDVFVFTQHKRRTSSGFAAEVYAKLRDFCSQFKSNFQLQHSDRKAVVYYGVVDPVAFKSDEKHEWLKSMSDVGSGLHAFFIDRTGCKTFFGPLADHPAFLPRIFINDRALTAGELALVLRPWATYADERASSLLLYRETQFSAKVELLIKDWKHLVELLSQTCPPKPRAAVLINKVVMPDEPTRQAIPIFFD
jgi:hypothetical protein